MHKIVLISPMHKYMCKISTRFQLFLQCARFVQDCTSFPNAHICTRFAQDCTSFPNAHICARFAQDCTSFHNVQYMWKIVLLSPICNICTRLQALLGEICHISHICSKFRMVFTSLLFLDCHKL